MLLLVSIKGSKYKVAAFTKNMTTLEGLQTLRNLYDHMIELQDEEQYVYNIPDTIVKAVWDYIDCYEGTTKGWEVSYDQTIAWEMMTRNSAIANPGQVCSIKINLDRDNQISQKDTVFSADMLFQEDFHFNGPVMDEDGYVWEPEILGGVIVDDVDELTYDELKSLKNKVCYQSDPVMWVYDNGGGTYKSTRP